MSSLFNDLDVDPKVFGDAAAALDHWQNRLSSLKESLKELKEEIKDCEHEVEKYQGELKDMGLTLYEKTKEGL